VARPSLPLLNVRTFLWVPLPVEGVRGLSENIRVTSILGEFLEHARILHFVNGVRDAYFIGSADLRERNLRRRVEVFASVLDPANRAQLAQLPDLEMHDSSAWTLHPDATWSAGTAGDHPSNVQQQFRQALLDPSLTRMSARGTRIASTNGG